jgi:hypothetical protein
MGRIATLKQLLEMSIVHRYSWGNQVFEFEDSKLKEMAKHVLDNWDGNKIPNLTKYGKLIKAKSANHRNLQDYMDNKEFWQQKLGK